MFAVIDLRGPAVIAKDFARIAEHQQIVQVLLFDDMWRDLRGLAQNSRFAAILMMFVVALVDVVPRAIRPAAHCFLRGIPLFIHLTRRAQCF